jgi:nucleotide-binding universal stress UspA family protein
MLEYKKILAPIDLSEVSPNIADYILTMAAKFDAEIHLLFVARILQHFAGYYVPSNSIAEFEKSLLDGAERRLYEFRDKYFNSWPRTQAIVVLGDISEEIVKYIETVGIDLLIMGTHGRRGLDRAVFGSVAERVIKYSPVPVFVVNTYRAKTA